MAEGTVKWFNQEKGFGFIAPDDGRDDLFADLSSIAEGSGSFNDGDRVSFEVNQGPKGPIAENVRKI